MTDMTEVSGPTEPCQAFGVGCGGVIVGDACSSCGALASVPDDEAYDASLDVEGPDEYDYSPEECDYFADRAADRYERNVLGL